MLFGVRCRAINNGCLVYAAHEIFYSLGRGMSITKTIIIFAKSIKHGGYCIAGKSIDNPREWIRPVSTIDGGELKKHQCLCTNPLWESQGNSPYSCKVLQKIEMGFAQSAPLPNQPENHLVLDATWRHNYNIGQNDIIKYCDNPDSLWGDDNRVDYSSIVNGAFPIEQSLYLVKTKNLKLYKQTEKTRASFEYLNRHYDLPVTDSGFYDNIGGESKLQGILCVSLGENYDGYCYKIVAGIY